MKMIVYTLVGSLLMLVGAIATAILSAEATGHLTFSIAELRANVLPEGSQDWIFCFFAAAFLVKMPAFPIHGWMPDAYRAAPLPVLALLSGVLSKVAAYGFLRVVLPIFPDATIQFQELILVIALAQHPLRLGDGVHADERAPDRGLLVDRPAWIHHPRRLRALRPTAPTARCSRWSTTASSWCRCSSIIALLAERARTEDLRAMGGLAMRAPVLTVMFLIVTLATLAMPGSANFIGEFYILNGLFDEKIVYAVVAMAGVALAAFYALRMYQRTMHNRLPTGVEVAGDLGWATRSWSRRWWP